LAALLKEVGSLFSLTTLDLRKCLNFEALAKEVANRDIFFDHSQLGCVFKLGDLVEKSREVSSFTTLDLSKLGDLAKRSGELVFLDHSRFS